MENISVNKFRDNLKSVVEEALAQHRPIKVTRRGTEDFIVIGAEDWEREQETLFVLQNSALMGQIAESMRTYTARTGYRPTDEEIHEIVGV
uniref:Antitoxin n=1 Tax=Candidatus Kentrum sp. FM TaxID=2126340 RepID=A0A450U2C7_9GAMM|nr:MAG: antitoxin YefM [Candidatus Kentron sp. FM]VFJ77132.1 MAG: antitoxin YefM [Candidatus Kentron sp. FM]VFK08081.1 MAG: antitoxin YefM [Candidatus Kentron sp. FM]